MGLLGRALGLPGWGLGSKQRRSRSLSALVLSDLVLSDLVLSDLVETPMVRLLRKQ